MTAMAKACSAARLRSGGIRVMPQGSTAKPRVLKWAVKGAGGSAAKRTFERRSALVRVCPGGRAGSLTASPPLWGCTKPGAVKCSVCLRGFGNDNAWYQNHIAKCNKPKDPLPLAQRQKIELWVRKGTTDENAFTEVFDKGGYERRRGGFRLEDCKVWLDLGGHIGTFSCMALARGCDVIAFEPHAENSALLEDNVRGLPASMGGANGGAACSLVLHRAAVASGKFREASADNNGTMELLGATSERETYRNTLMREKRGVPLCSADCACTKCGRHFGSNVVLKKHEAKCKCTGEIPCTNCGLKFSTKKRLARHERSCKGQKVRKHDYCPAGRVPVVTLQEVLRAYPQIEGVKIDIEGAEIEMLEEMQPADWRNVKRLTFEYSNEFDNSAPRLRGLLANLSRHFLGGVYPDKPGTYEEGDEIKFPVYLAMVVHASTDALEPIRRLKQEKEAKVAAKAATCERMKRVSEAGIRKGIEAGTSAEAVIAAGA